MMKKYTIIVFPISDHGHGRTVRTKVVQKEPVRQSITFEW
jgi:hypothetical protein